MHFCKYQYLTNYYKLSPGIFALHWMHCWFCISASTNSTFHISVCSGRNQLNMHFGNLEIICKYVAVLDLGNLAISIEYANFSPLNKIKNASLCRDG